MKPRILFVTFELLNWRDASHWGYPTNIGMEQGLIANDVEYLIVPATHKYGDKAPFWIDHVRSLVNGQKFDQVWLEVVHSHIDEDILEYLSALAPIRLGWSCESLEVLPVERENNPEGCRIRDETIEKHLAILTHLLTADELDAPRLNKRGTLVAKPILPGFSVPREFICDNPSAPIVNCGLFYGTLYGERQKWLEMPELSGLLQYVEQSPEVFTTIPQSFDALQERALKILRSSAVDRSTLDLYLNEYRLIRKEAFTLWLEGLRLGAAVVNLPQWGRVYAGRVVEGMAAGRPVITREMPDRPLAKAAFEDGKEILLYREPHELAEHLRRIISEPSFGEGIAHNARRRLHASHTTEGYIAHLLEWLKS